MGFGFVLDFLDALFIQALTKTEIMKLTVETTKCKNISFALSILIIFFNELLKDFSQN